jgi:DNA-binding transcriptional LysR family regulator
MLPAYVCQPMLAASRLVELLPGWEIAPYEMKLVSTRSKNLSRAQQAFRQYIDAFSFSMLSNGF